MNSKAMLAVAVAGILVYCVPCANVKASATEQEPLPTQTCSEENQAKAAGLIKRYEIYVSENNGDLCISGSTISSSQMYSIGFIDIDVERSRDNVHWSKEKGLSDMLSYSTKEKHINNYTTDVEGGYYYRITCNHYAKVSMFGSFQSVSNTSNSVWID